jgi:putative tryptophan/tyrosine transport system substrate-binding protein
MTAVLSFELAFQPRGEGYMRRRQFITLLGAAASWPLPVRAQQPSMPVIGWLGRTRPEAQPHLIAAFHQGLKEPGFVDGRNVVIEYLWANDQDDRLPALAAEFVRRRVDVIAAITAASSVAAKRATASIPIVFLAGSDPVELGLVASLNRPGGNLTGATILTHVLNAKRLEVIRELIPAARTIAVMMNPKNPAARSNAQGVQAAAGTLGLQLHILNASTEDEINAAFATVMQLRVDALLVAADSFLYSRSDQLLALAARHRVPAVWEWRDLAQAGGLMSYGTVLADSLRQVGVYSGRILRGEKPADLPVLQPTKFELVVNLKTAKALGLEVPPTLLARADEVIE